METTPRISLRQKSPPRFHIERLWEEKIKKVERARIRYEKLHIRYKKIIVLETFELRMTGVITLMILILGLLSFPLSVIKVNFFPHQSFLILEVAQYVGKAYCAAVLIFVGVLTHYKRQSDPFRFITKMLQKSWNDVYTSIGPVIESKRFNCKSLNSKPQSTRYFQDLLVLTNLGIEAYGTDTIDRQERLSFYSNLLEWRSDVLTLVVDNKNEPIGFFCTIPFDTDKGRAGQKHYWGKANQFQVSADMIATGKSDLVFVQSLYIKPKYLDDPSALVYFLNCFYNKVGTLLDEREPVLDQSVVYAEPNTNHNNELFRILGFQFFGKRNETKQHKFLELRFSETLRCENAFKSIVLLKSIINDIW